MNQAAASAAPFDHVPHLPRHRRSTVSGVHPLRLLVKASHGHGPPRRDGAEPPVELGATETRTASLGKEVGAPGAPRGRDAQLTFLWLLDRRSLIPPLWRTGSGQVQPAGESGPRLIGRSMAGLRLPPRWARASLPFRGRRAARLLDPGADHERDLELVGDAVQGRSAHERRGELAEPERQVDATQVPSARIEHVDDRALQAGRRDREDPGVPLVVEEEGCLEGRRAVEIPIPLRRPPPRTCRASGPGRASIHAHLGRAPAP